MRGLFARRLASLLLLVATVPQPVIAQERAIDWHAEYRIEISGPTRVCKGVEAKYTVEVIRYGVGVEGSTTRYLDWGNAATTLHVAVDGQSSPFRTQAGGGTMYRRTFRSVGTYTLTFSADYNQISVGVGAYALAPLTIEVTVVDCTYKVTTLSVWIIPQGFRPWMGAVMQQVTMVPTTAEGPEYRAEGTLENVAIPQLGIGCQVAYAIANVDVKLRGLAGMIRDVRTGFQLELHYDAGSIGSAGTGVSCPRVGGGTSDSFTLDPLIHFFPAEGGSVQKPHVLHAIRIGDILGRTVIVVTPDTQP